MTHPATDRAVLARGYATSAQLNDRASIYSYNERTDDFVGDALRLLGPLEPPARVLDVGCGPGRYLERLGAGQRCSGLIGLDLSEGMVREARQRLTPLPVASATLVGDAQALPFPDGSFNAVLAMHMLYHVPDIARAASELARVCQAQGVVLIMTNGEAHLPRLRADFEAAVATVAGRIVALPTASSARFRLETATDQLRGALTVASTHDFSNRLVVPDAGAVVRYMNSAREHYAPSLPSDVHWEEVMSALGDRVTAAIDAEGAWATTTHAGVLACRPVRESPSAPRP